MAPIGWSSHQPAHFAAFTSCEQPLLPGLPDDVALHILALLPASAKPLLRTVSTAWHQALGSRELAALRRGLQKTEEWVYVVGKSRGRQKLLVLSPLDSRWYTLGDLPYITCTAVPGGGLEDSPLHGFELAAVGGELLLLGGCQTLSTQALCTRLAEEGPHENGAAAVSGGQRQRQGHAVAVEAFQAGLLQEGAGGSAGGSADGRDFSGIRSEQVAVPGVVWVYSTVSNRWRRGANMLEHSRTFFASGVIDGKVYVAGGLSAGGEQLETAEVYDPKCNTWQPLEPMPRTPASARCTGRCAGAVVKGLLHVFEVCAGGGGLLVLRGVYNPATGGWSTPHSTPCRQTLSERDPSSWTSGGGVRGIQVAVVRDRLFFTRGLLDDFQGGGDRELREYHVATNEWSTVSFVPGPRESLGQDWPVVRQAFGLACASGAVLVVGGEAWTRLFGRLDVGNVQVYNPELASWRPTGHYVDPGFLGTVWKCAAISQ